MYGHYNGNFCVGDIEVGAEGCEGDFMLNLNISIFLSSRFSSFWKKFWLYCNKNQKDLYINIYFYVYRSYSYSSYSILWFIVSFFIYFLITDTPPFKYLGQYDLKKIIYTFILQGRIQLIKSHSKGISDVTQLFQIMLFLSFVLIKESWKKSNFHKFFVFKIFST